MLKLYIGVFVIFVFIFIVAIWSRKYINRYRLYMVFGKKGSGKTTYMTKLAVRYHKKGWHVFSNVEMPYAQVIDVQELGKLVPPRDSVLLIDEVGIIWDNRNFKAFRDDVRNYFKFQRQYRNIVYLFSQTFDIDLKLRNLTDAMYLCVSPIPILSVVKRIKRNIVLVQPVADAEGKISDSLEFVPMWKNLFGAKAVQFTFIPFWAKYFKSFNPPALPEFTYDSPYLPQVLDNPKRSFRLKLWLAEKIRLFQYSLKLLVNKK